MKRNYAFFQNKECEFFPCHKGIKEEDFNCLFCYCPLYFVKECKGNHTYTKNGIKDCSKCLIPHGKENYTAIMNTIESTTKQQNQEAFSKIKAIFFDLDYTLTFELQKVPEQIIELFEKLKKKGFITIIATARFMCESYAYTDKLKPDYIICDNGAKIVNIDEDGTHRAVYNYPIQKEDFANMLKRLEHVKPFVSIQHKDEYYYTISEEAMADNIGLCLGEVRYSEERGLTNVIKMESTMDYPKEYYESTNRIFVVDIKDTYNMKKELEDLSEFSEEVRFTRSSPGRYEFTSTNKGVAVRKLTEMLGLKKEETMSFGDSEADIQLFLATGIGVAMENAIDEAKKAAQFVCPHVNQYGTKLFLEEHFDLD